eukprot:g20944.t1
MSQERPDRKPFYGLRCEDLLIPEEGRWQCFYGPPPAPSFVKHIDWVEHFQNLSGKLKEEGNSAMKANRPADAEELYGSLDLRFEDSAEDSKRCLELDPQHVKAAVRLAKALKALNRLSDACQPLARLLQKTRSKTAGEVQAWYLEAEALKSCEEADSSSSRTSLLGVHRAASSLREAGQDLIFQPSFSAKLEDRFGGRVCPMIFRDTASTDPFLLVAHHRHSFFAFDPLRYLFRFLLPEGFPAHPHRGFETVTYVLRGGLVHRDSRGVKKSYGAPKDASGDGEGAAVQWMTAGRGLLHEEMWRTGGEWESSDQELFQIWVNLPQKQKMDPRMQMLGDLDIDGSSQLPRQMLGPESSVEVHERGPVPTSEPSKGDYFLGSISFGQREDFSEPACEVTVNTEQLPVHNTATLSRSCSEVSLAAGEDPAEVLILAGAPLDEPVAMGANIIMNSQQELAQANADLRMGMDGIPEEGRDECGTHVSSELPLELDLRGLLKALPRIFPHLAPRPAARLAQGLLRHKLRESLFIADALLEIKGFSRCLKGWCRCLDDRAKASDEASHANRAAEVLQELAAQVVLTLLRNWTQNSKVLKSLSPLLVGKLWPSVASKLRRDAGVAAVRDIKGPANTQLKMDSGSSLKKGYGAFHPEELATASMQFLLAHFDATCERGCEEPREGIAARAPAEEWVQDVLDRPFGWGVLETIAKRLAGLHAFMPLLQLPWPQADPVESHLPATLSVPSTRRSAAKVLQCAMDTDLGMRLSSSLPSQSVVKFFVTKAARSYLMPWVVHRESNVTGSGFVIEGRLLMTNAHVIEDAMVVEVKKHDLPKKFRARVVCIGHDVDLALVERGQSGWISHRRQHHLCQQRCGLTGGCTDLCAFQIQRSGSGYPDAWCNDVESGLSARSAEDAMREYLHMGQRTGVRVVSVAPLGAAQGKLQPGDILVEVDGLHVSNEHTVPVELGEQKVDLDYGVLISQKQKGELTKVKVLRDGKELEQEITFAPIPPLARRFDRYDSAPRYLLVGGLVFSVMSLPLFNEFCELRREDRRLNVTTTSLSYRQAGGDAISRPEQEVIILLRTLKHPVNLGYNFCCTRILSRFNGKAMESLAQLAEEVSKALDTPEDFLRFGFEDDPEEFDSMVLKADGIRKADLELCKNHRISQPSSRQWCGAFALLAVLLAPPSLGWISSPQVHRDLRSTGRHARVDGPYGVLPEPPAPLIELEEKDPVLEALIHVVQAADNKRGMDISAFWIKEGFEMIVMVTALSRPQLQAISMEIENRLRHKLRLKRRQVGSFCLRCFLKAAQLGWIEYGPG